MRGLLCLVLEAQQRPLQRFAHLTANEEAFGDGREDSALNERVSEFDRHPGRLTFDLESRQLLAAQRGIGELDPVQPPRLVLEHPFSDGPRPAGVERQTSVDPSSGYPAEDSSAAKPSTHATQPRGSK